MTAITQRTRALGRLLPVALAGLLAMGAARAADDTSLTVRSPDGRITATLTYHEDAGNLTYRVRSNGREIVAPSAIGLDTDRGDFRSGATLAGSSRRTIDERYTLPQGKVSTYRNHANELVVRLRKGPQELQVRFRAYDDGVAFGYVVPGEGEVEIHGESSAIHLSGDHFAYWGQNHPNNYGYETPLGPIDGEMMSNPVLAHLEDRDHFVLIGQAGTYGNYVETHFERTGSSFHYSFPMDQARLGPVRTALPFESPWRMIIVSPHTPGRIVQSYLVENLNPPTDPALLDVDGTVKDWVRPGRVMWDFIAGDRDRPRMWVDDVAKMGWEYYMADAGFAQRFGGPDSVLAATRYAAQKGVGILGWAHTRDFDSYEKAKATMGRYADWGLKGAKIDFFDQNTLSEDPRDWRDYVDTQQSLRMRDWIFRLAAENHFLLELHGSKIPTGERRRYPNLLTLESVAGMEKRVPSVTNDLTIPFVRNVMGPVSYTVIRLHKSIGSYAYQLAMPIVYEAGLMIYAEHGDTLLAWPGREMIQDLPNAWDEIRFLDGTPGSHIVVARRRGDEWYIGGMTAAPRTEKIRLDFLAPGKEYDLLLFRDGTHTSMRREARRVRAGSELSVDLLQNGGFAARLRPATTPR